jgi:hypothetical protein
VNVQAYRFLFLFFHPSVSVYFFTYLKMKLLYILLVYIFFIVYIHIAGYIQNRVFYGKFKGFAMVILTICDFGFMLRFQIVTLA